MHTHPLGLSATDSPMTHPMTGPATPRQARLATAPTVCMSAAILADTPTQGVAAT